MQEANVRLKDTLGVRIYCLVCFVSLKVALTCVNFINMHEIIFEEIDKSPLAATLSQNVVDPMCALQLRVEFTHFAALG